MTEQRPPDDELREQAATWFARMRGPDADRLKPEFERWIASGPERRVAYSRIAARFSEARLLRHSPSARYPSIAGPTARHLHRLALALAALLGVSCAMITAFPHLATDLLHRERLRSASISTRHGEIRTVRLSDGSVIALDTDSVLLVRYTAIRRELTLERGRARFDVAHEDRPFIVTAARSEVTARGTLFDVEIDPQSGVRVALMRGAVDVAPTTGSTGRSIVRRLRPGDAIAVESSSAVIRRLGPATIQPGWPTGLVDFDETSIADVAAAANRYSAEQIVLADPEVRGLRVSGRFSVRSTATLADSLANLFDLEVDRSTPGQIILRRAPPKLFFAGDAGVPPPRSVDASL